MENLLADKSLPLGFRFHPTDEEVFMYYLKRKVMGKSLQPQMIADVNVYRFAPWDLPEKSCLKTRDLNWYFFCPRGKKYGHGGRTNRATEHGYWKSTGTDRTVKYNHRPVGKIKTLIFHRGKAPNGDRTDWVMHEYRLEDKVLADKGISQDAYVVCKIYKKSGVGPKNGEHYGAPYVEEEWESDKEDNVENDGGVVVCQNVSTSMDIPVGSTAVGSTAVVPATTTSTEEQVVLIEIQGDELDRMLLATFTEEDDIRVNVRNEMVDNDIYNGLGDLADGFCSSMVDFNWSQFLCDSGDCYMELNDLKD